ncbi:MAG: 1-phosphofructokinase [Dehalococcoidia bacterium]
MIITVTLNPAIDQTLVVSHLVPGDTNRVKAGRFDPGGKGINVSRVIHELGGQSLAMGFAPGSLGRYIEHTLAEAGIACDFLHTRGQTRTNITIVDEARSVQTVISAPGPETDPRHFDRLLERVRRHVQAGDWVVLAGSIPPPLPPTVYRALVEMVQRRGAKAVLDADGDALAAGLEARPYMMKANRWEVERLLGHSLPDATATVRAAEGIHQGGVAIVVVTRGREGAVAVSDEGVWWATAPRVHPTSTVGAGDALLAAVVLVLGRGGPLTEGLQLGCAAGTATCLTPGTELCHCQEVERFLPRVRIQSLSQVAL